MTSQELPEALSLLRDALDSPGPADYRTPTQELALVNSALDEAERWPNVVPFRRRRGVQVAGAVLLLVSSAAAASWVGGVFSAAAPAEPLSPPPTTQQSRKQSAAAAEAATDVEVEPAVTAPALAESAPPNGRTIATAKAPPAAKDLLSHANQLRAAGKRDEAERVYDEILRTQPGTSAAYVAAVSGAQLKLGSNPAAARRLLLQARRESPGGALSLEISRALANAYRAHGNTAEEKRELEAIVRKYPTGVVAQDAKARLKELEQRP